MTLCFPSIGWPTLLLPIPWQVCYTTPYDSEGYPDWTAQGTQTLGRLHALCQRSLEKKRREKRRNKSNRKNSTQPVDLSTWSSSPSPGSPRVAGAPRSEPLRSCQSQSSTCPCDPNFEERAWGALLVGFCEKHDPPERKTSFISCWFRFKLIPPPPPQKATIEKTHTHTHGCGSKLGHQGTAGFNLWFHLRSILGTYF